MNLVIMGKTGAGKSTLINALMEDDVAPAGVGQAVTKETQVYSRDMSIIIPDGNDALVVRKQIHFYDTVGLEIDSSTTKQTEQKTKQLISALQQKKRENDISLVWFCINDNGSRFEAYERKLIREISGGCEIPLLIVITQCLSTEKDALEREIVAELPEVPVVRVLAKDFQTVAGAARGFGLSDLMTRSVMEYERGREKVLKLKLDMLLIERQHRMDRLRQEGLSFIKRKAESAKRVGVIPGGCIPLVHGICVSTISGLNKIVEIKMPNDFAANVAATIIMGAICTPLMAVPILSAISSEAYVMAVGETYLDSLMNVISRSTDEELRNSKLMERRICGELNRK